MNATDFNFEQIEHIVPHNTFESRLHPIGQPLELLELCVRVSDGSRHLASIVSVEDDVYTVNFEEDVATYYVNTSWAIALSAANDSAYCPAHTLLDIVQELIGGTIEICGSTDFRLDQMDISFKAVDGDVVEHVIVPPLWSHILLALSKKEREPTIPENSGSLHVDETTSRFSGAIWYENIQKKTVTIAGVGGIGSYVTFLLGRMKPSQIILYDPDVVEAANMSGQLYSSNDIGSYKVESITSMISKYANYYNVISFPERFNSESEATDIMICGFDNMEARRLFFDKWTSRVLLLPESERGKCLFIDGRLAAEEFQVFAIQGNDERAMKEYESKWLFSDSEADETICSYKQTTFMANMIASVMVNLFVNFAANECGPLFPRDVPFMTSYSADTMYFKVEM